MRSDFDRRKEEVLYILAAGPNGLTNKEIRRRLHYQRATSTIQKYLNTLEEEGRVKRSEDNYKPTYHYIPTNR
jgi:DNA-binding IclR family transcriptional regulator